MEQVPTIFGDVAALALGACVGSFGDGRVPLAAPHFIATPRSFCESCERPVPWWANIPIFAYLASRGRCLMCGRRLGAPPGRRTRARAGRALLIRGFSAGRRDCALRLHHRAAHLLAGRLRLAADPQSDHVSRRPGGFCAGRDVHARGWMEKLANRNYCRRRSPVRDRLSLPDGARTGGRRPRRRVPAAMVGAFIGWQGVLFTLFFGALLGSFGGLVVGLFGTPRDDPNCR